MHNYIEIKPHLNMLKVQRIINMILSIHLFPTIQQLQCVPLYGDLQMEVFAYIKKTPNFEGHKSIWTCDSSAKLEAQYNLLQQLPSMKEEHTSYISELATHSHKVGDAHIFITTHPDSCDRLRRSHITQYRCGYCRLE